MKIIFNPKPNIGPVIGGFLAEHKGWRWVFWLIVIVEGAVFVPAVLIMRESYGPYILSQKAKRLRSETGNTELRSKYNVDGKLISQRQKLTQAMIRPVKMFLFLPIGLYLSLGYGYMWMTFTILNLVYENVYNFSQGQVGLTYLGVAIETILSDVLIGLFSDRYMVWAAGGGEMKPEYRLPPMVLGAIFVPGGLILYGWAADFKLHWAIPLLGTGMMGFGILMSLLVAQGLCQ